MAEKTPPTFNKAAFTSNFQGMEDLALEAIRCFIATLPSLLADLEAAVRGEDASRIESLAHTLKGAVSNFYAEPSRNLANKLEQMGNSRVVTGAADRLTALKAELERLTVELKQFTGKKA